MKMVSVNGKVRLDSEEEFILRYMEAYREKKTVAQFAVSLGWSKPNVYTWACKIRKKCPSLPYLKPNYRTITKMSGPAARRLVERELSR